MRVILFFLLSIISVNCFSFEYKQWWEDWYISGHTSGAGSRGVLAQFKADVINEFLDGHSIHTVIEFGCGDGYNLGLINYENYLGLDVSKEAVRICDEMYIDDESKYFQVYIPKSFGKVTDQPVDLVVCLDVLYHVLDEDEYQKLLDDIFSFSPQFVILYTTLSGEGISGSSPEILHRNVLGYLEKYSDYDLTIKWQKHKELTKAHFIFLQKLRKQ